MDLLSLTAWCIHGASDVGRIFGGTSGPVLALALAGVAGSPLHCGPMCGPFVMGQVSDRLAATPPALLCGSSRLSRGLLLPYHLGRITTYAALGAILGMIGAGAIRLPWMGGLSAGLLLSAALWFLIEAARRLASGKFGARGSAAARLPPPLMALLRLVPRDTWLGTLALGLLLGFLPCGFLYAALIAAAATASPLWGGLAMIAFGIGTAPSLIAIGVMGHWAARRFGDQTRRAAPWILLLNALVLGGSGIQRLLPLLR